MHPSFLLTPKFLSAWFGLSIGNWACLTKPFSYDYIQWPCQWVSGQCPGGGDRACRFCLSNEITSHSGPVRQKTQRDQCRTAGLQRVAVLVKVASMNEACVKNMFCFSKIYQWCCRIELSSTGITVKKNEICSFLFGKLQSCFILKVLPATFLHITKLQYLKY